MGTTFLAETTKFIMGPFCQLLLLWCQFTIVKYGLTYLLKYTFIFKITLFILLTSDYSHTKFTSCSLQSIQI